VGQTLPHPPQLFGSVASSTQVPLQHIAPLPPKLFGHTEPFGYAVHVPMPWAGKPMPRHDVHWSVQAVSQQ